MESNAFIFADNVIECVKSFLILKINVISEHALATFHPSSNGNVFHASVLLLSVVKFWAKCFIVGLHDKANLKCLFKNVVLNCLHYGNVEQLLLELLVFSNAQTAKLDNEFKSAKKELFELLSKYKLFEHYCKIICNPKEDICISQHHYSFLVLLLEKLAIVDSAKRIMNDESCKKILENILLNGLECKKPERQVMAADMLRAFIEKIGMPEVEGESTARNMMLGIPEMEVNQFHEF
eukprot:UN34868